MFYILECCLTVVLLYILQPQVMVLSTATICLVCNENDKFSKVVVISCLHVYAY